MCVIFIAETRRPTEVMVDKAYFQNNAGAGIAWRDSGYVKWEKGIDLAKVQDLVTKLPMPFVVHFRIPTEGGKRVQLCHPFPIEKTAPLDLKGRTKGMVLFHNGHWAEWRKVVLDTLARFPAAVLPPGKWSDSRAIAWCAAYYGYNVLELINEKAVAFGPGQNDLDAAGSGWSLIDEQPGLWASNRVWEFRNNNHFDNLRPYCREIGCSSKDLVSRTPYCSRHQKGKIITATALPEAADSEDEKKTSIETATSFKESVGGDSTESPFEHSFRIAYQLWQEGKISKKRFKKAKRIYEAYLRTQLQLPESAVVPDLRLVKH